MVITMFAGWTGRPIGTPLASCPPPAVDERDPASEIACALRRGLGGTIVLTASSPEVTLRKTVYPDGRSALEVTRGTERLLLTAGETSVTVVRAHRTAVVNVNTASEEDLVRFREPLVVSGAVRSLRSLTAAVEELGGDAHDRLAVRLTGALVAQYDGDPRAIARLCRELQINYSSRARRTGPPPSPARAAFRRAVLRAGRQFEDGVESYAFWNPARQGCAYSWLSQVESAWHAWMLAEPGALPQAHASASGNANRMFPWPG
jgi:hypothetical protein